MTNIAVPRLFHAAPNAERSASCAGPQNPGVKETKHGQPGYITMRVWMGPTDQTAIEQMPLEHDNRIVAMTEDRSLSSMEQHIDANLRRIYSEKPGGPLPHSLAHLLEQLRQQDESGPRRPHDR